MRITKIGIPETETIKRGLQSIKMDKLGQVVLLAGKNGSGKSRMLGIIQESLIRKPSKQTLEHATKYIPELEKYISNSENNIIYYKNLISQETDPVKSGQLKLSLENEKKNLSLYENDLKKYKEFIDWNEIETSEVVENYSVVHFVPKYLFLTDCNKLSKHDLIAKSNQVESLGMSYLHEGVFAKIQQVQDRWFNATHPNSTIPLKEKENAIKDYKKLQELINLFFQTELERTIDDEASLFGFALGKSNLSDGQKILIQFCVAIYSQETQLKDLILFLDEPENHLHPSVIIETIENIINCIPNGQVWIATHSIPLLAHFDPSCIWYVEDGKVEYGGSIPEKVLESLLGDDEEIGKLQDFISLPAQFATSRYAFESLLEPAVVSTDSKDPQTRQIRTDLLANVTDGKLKVLDYGAGKGRLLSNIFDLDIENQTNLIENLDYIAYDEYPKDKDFCELTLSKVYGTSKNRYYNDMNKLLTEHDKESFDVVVLCNVLHEIEPKDWGNLFKEGGKLNQLLKETGILLIVEDNLIPTGEKAYQNGFLVLDTPQIKELFSISSTEKKFIINSERNGRLNSHQIPKEYLKNITTETKRKAITDIQERAQIEIKKLRNDPNKNFKNGKLHGFWTQQLANATLSLSEL